MSKITRVFGELRKACIRKSISRYLRGGFSWIDQYGEGPRVVRAIIVADFL